MCHFSILNRKNLSYYFSIFMLLCFFVQTSSAQSIKRMYAKQTDAPPKIDGLLNDAAWKTAKPAKDFTSYFPTPGLDAEQQTEVRILYDDKAIYVSAIINEEDVSQVAKELSVRDDNNLQTDIFQMFIDPYAQGQNAWGFGVTASGIQIDMSVNRENEEVALGGLRQPRINVPSLDRFMSSGRTGERIYEGVVADVERDPLGESDGLAWDAVWESAVKTYRNAWTVEMKIPYSTLRFPDKDVQVWGINFMRITDKNDETAFWNEVDPAQEGFVNQFGRLHGIRKISPPTRLSFTPYLLNRFDFIPTGRDTSNWQSTLAGGVDLRIGINETTTLDFSLIPDFGQVQFDDIVLNLGPFEQRFDENRPFFTEGFEIFDRGGIFYSRRIGEEPINRQLLEDDADLPLGEQNILTPSQTLTQNPIRSPLINATKLTTRNRKGLGVGFFNALTGRTFAEAQEGNGAIFREIPTGPTTNYNVIVFDQLLPNNSHVSFTNTNVIRGGSTHDTIVSNLTNGGFRDANVTALEYTLFDDDNNYGIIGRGAISQLFQRDANDNPRTQAGFAYNVKAGKFGGRFRYSLERDVESRKYDANDLGFSTQNRIFHRGRIEYKLLRSFFGFYDLNFYGGINHEQRFAPLAFANYFVEGGAWWTFKNNLGMGVFGEYFPRSSTDFFESRREGLPFIVPKNYEVNTFIATDLANPFSYQFNFAYRAYPEWDARATRYGALARLRLGRGLNLQTNLDYVTRRNDHGFVDDGADGAVIVGRRDRRDITSAVTANIIFSPKMSITARGRHFWALVDYQEYFQLRQDGSFRSTTYDEDNNVSFNLYNIDLIYRFRFAPGSEFNIIWKRSLLNDNTEFTYNYLDNWAVLNEDVTPDNLFSVKFLYYLDYLTIQRRQRAARQ